MSLRIIDNKLVKKPSIVILFITMGKSKLKIWTNVMSSKLPGEQINTTTFHLYLES